MPGAVTTAMLDVIVEEQQRRRCPLLASTRRARASCSRWRRRASSTMAPASPASALLALRLPIPTSQTHHTFTTAC